MILLYACYCRCRAPNLHYLPLPGMPHTRYPYLCHTTHLPPAPSAPALHMQDQANTGSSSRTAWFHLSSPTTLHLTDTPRTYTLHTTALHYLTTTFLPITPIPQLAPRAPPTVTPAPGRTNNVVFARCNVRRTWRMARSVVDLSSVSIPGRQS